jgi:hypothetical protein
MTDNGYLPSLAEHSERTILGAFERDPTRFPEVDLSITEFGLASHRVIYGAMAALHSEGRGWDDIVLAEVLRQRGELGILGETPLAYLASLTEGLYPKIPLDEHVALIREAARKRKLEALGERLLQHVQDPTQAAVGLESHLRTFVDQLAESTSIKTQAAGYTLTPLGELFLKPEAPTDYVWMNRLVAGTVSIVAAKPKVGKSVFGRNLTFAVATGNPFIGLPTKQGSVLYLGLEEREQEITADFRALGATGKEPIFVHVGPPSPMPIADLIAQIRERRPCLVVVDPMIRILPPNGNGDPYAQAYAVLGPLVDVALETGTHIQLLHHSPKGEKLDTIDALLGSIGLAGIAATVLVYKRTPENYRTLETRQRVGDDLPETMLTFDKTTKRLSVGASREVKELDDTERRILELLAATPGKAQPLSLIRNQVKGDTGVKGKALNSLCAEGKVLRFGKGKRNAPFLYSKA